MNLTLNISDSFSSRALAINQSLISYGIWTMFMVVITLYYWYNIKKLKPTQTPAGLTFLIYTYISWINSLSVEILGPKYKRFTPFFIYTFSLLFISNLFGLFGIEPIGISYVVVLSLSIFVFIVMIISGIYFQKWSYINEYLSWVTIKGKKVFPVIDPLKVLGKITPIISLSLRFWGNVFAGTLIMGMIYGLFKNSLFSHNSVHWFFSLLTGLIVFPFHFYFDILDGIIHSLIFIMLSMVYINMESGIDVDVNEHNPVDLSDKWWLKSLNSPLSSL